MNKAMKFAESQSHCPLIWSLLPEFQCSIQKKGLSEDKPNWMGSVKQHVKQKSNDVDRIPNEYE